MWFKTRNAKPELVAGKAERTSRPVLADVYLNAERGEVWATDSYIAVRLPVEVEDGDTTGPIPLDAIKAARKSPLKNVPDTSIRVNHHAEVRMGQGEDASEPYLTVPRHVPEDYSYPDLERFFPENLATFQVGLNPTKLMALARAMGADGPNGIVRLRFTMGDDREPSPIRPIVVDRSSDLPDDESPIGLLMPVRLA